MFLEAAVRGCKFTRINVVILCVIFLLGSYMVGFWSVRLTSRDVEGSKRYHVVATVNWYSDNNVTETGHKLKADQLDSITRINTSNIVIPTTETHHTYSCQKLIEGDFNEQQKILQRPYTGSSIVSTGYYTRMTQNCDAFRKERSYIMSPLSEEEADFPLAFTILMFKDIARFERLLRAIYRPQNYYCIHVDAKSSQTIKDAINGIKSCFDNVFMASRAVDVQWAYYSVLEPEIICMEQLWQYKKWKYFINLTGQEFPLKTNGEIVRILKTLNGANNMEGTVKRRNKMRTVYVHHGIYATKKTKSPVPVAVTFTKGSVHIIAQRGYVDYILHNKQALQLREWIKDTGVPDETFFTSLNYSPDLGVPGAYLGEPETDKIDPPPPQFPVNPFIARFKNWGDGPFNWPCGGQRVRMVCIFGVKDLPMLVSRFELFANKFYSDYQVEAYNCLEEWHYNRTREELQNGPSIDLTFYKKLDIVKNHVT